MLFCCIMLHNACGLRSLLVLRYGNPNTWNVAEQRRSTHYGNNDTGDSVCVQSDNLLSQAHCLSAEVCTR